MLVIFNCWELIKFSIFLRFFYRQKFIKSKLRAKQEGVRDDPKKDVTSEARKKLPNVR